MKVRYTFCLLFLVWAHALILAQSLQPGSATVTLSANYHWCVAPGSLATVFTDERIHPSAKLGVTSIKLTDRRGNEFKGEVKWTGPKQTNFLVPKDIATGPADIEVNTGVNELSRGKFFLAFLTPGLFTANADGLGVPAAVALRVKGNVYAYEPILQLSVDNKYVPIPIKVSDSTEQVFLVLFGTGFGNNWDLNEVKGKIDGLDTQVYYSGPQGPSGVPGTFPGLDQINLLLPVSLLSGKHTIQIAYANLKTNEVSIETK